MVWLILYLGVGLAFVPRAVFRYLLKDIIDDEESPLALGFATLLTSLIAMIASFLWPLFLTAYILGMLIRRNANKSPITSKES